MHPCTEVLYRIENGAIRGMQATNGITNIAYRIYLIDENHSLYDDLTSMFGTEGLNAMKAMDLIAHETFDPEPE